MPKKKRPVQVDEFRLLRQQDRRRHGKRRAHHAAHHDGKTPFARPFAQDERRRQAACLVKLDVHRVVEPFESRQILGRMHTLVGADRHRPLDFAQDRILPDRQRLLDERHAATGCNAQILGKTVWPPALVRIDDQPAAGGSLGHRAQAGGIVLAAQFDLQKRPVRVGACLGCHFLGRTEGDGLRRGQCARGRTECFLDTPARAFGLQVPERAVERVARRTGRHELHQRLTVYAIRHGAAHGLDLCYHAFHGLPVAGIGHAFAAARGSLLGEGAGDHLRLGFRTAGDAEDAGYGKTLDLDGQGRSHDHLALLRPLVALCTDFTGRSSFLCTHQPLWMTLMVFGASRQAGGTAVQEKAEPARIDCTRDDGVLTCRLSGDWTTRTVGEVDGRIRELLRSEEKRLDLDLGAIRHLDTAGAWLVGRLIADQKRRGATVSVSGESSAATILLDAVMPIAEAPEAPPESRGGSWFIGLFAAVGRSVHDALNDILYGLHILGATVSGAQMKLGRKHAVNPAAIIHQIDRMGVGAIPIIVLMSAIVGAIIAQQGAFQLRYFGAEIFVVDLVGILVMRELGVLLTAIMIAGRSGSAITAEIGSMKMREEVDALTVIGLNPVGVLVFPRMVALVIALPCLTIISNFAALGGAMGISWLYSGIAPSTFIDRLRDAIDLTSIFSGLIKAPFMALIIGVIASVEGMKVGGSAESLGRQVTTSVVKAIFVVIVVDGLFAIFYAAIDF